MASSRTIWYTSSLSFFFWNKSGKRAADYIKKKISPKWAQRYNNDQQPRWKTNSTSDCWRLFLSLLRVSEGGYYLCPCWWACLGVTCHPVPRGMCWEFLMEVCSCSISSWIRLWAVISNSYEQQPKTAYFWSNSRNYGLWQLGWRINHLLISCAI
jgi:hypothetical protein